MKANRKNLIVNPKFQYAMIAYMMALAAIVTFVAIMTNLYLFRQLELKAVELGLREGHHFYEFLKDQKTMTLIVSGANIFFMALVIFWGGLFISNRIAGPLYRLKTHLDSIVEKNEKPSKVYFRNDDFFRELEVAFNKFIKHINKEE